MRDIAAPGEFYEVTCESPLESIYEELAKADKIAAGSSVILANDVSGSMNDPMSLRCGTTDIKHFLAEMDILDERESKEYVLVDSEKYSSAVSALMSAESYHKQPESVECQFDCGFAGCDAPCGEGRCLGCNGIAGEECECCAECHQIYDYQDRQYQEYKSMYGSPYAEYLFCHKTPLKDTAWCYQRNSLATSAINYPWYSFAGKNYEQRNLEVITDSYLEDIHEWNSEMDIKEKPHTEVVEDEIWLPDSCNHNFDNKLFRTVWTEVFTATPFLNDNRNLINWTRTGEGSAFAGGGFRREPACWWECCRECAPCCDCDCVDPCPNDCTPPCGDECTVLCGAGCGDICCLQAQFSSGVNKEIKFTVSGADVSSDPITVSPNCGNYAMAVTVDNGAFNVISIGNIPFTICNPNFVSNPADGEYTLTMDYIPQDTSAQFVIAEDIMFNYEIPELSDEFGARIDETFTTELDVLACKCINHCVCTSCDEGTCTDWDCHVECEQPDPPEGAHVSTQVTVWDSLVGEGGIDWQRPKIDLLKEAANSFVDLALPRGISIGLVSFSTSVVSSFPTTFPPLSTDPVALHNEINSYTPLASTCISCGIDEARILLSAEPSDKTIIVMSDGVQNAGRDARDAAADAYNIEGIIVHSVALGNGADIALLQDIATNGHGNFYNVTCDVSLEDIYQELAGDPAVVPDNSAVVLVSDVSGSMSSIMQLDCGGSTGTMPVIHEDILRDIELNITGRIDNYAEGIITEKGFLNITVTPDIMNGFILNVGNVSLYYSSLMYPVRHKLYRKEFAQGYWAPGATQTFGEIREYEYFPSGIDYLLDDSYGYEQKVVGQYPQFEYPEQFKKICPANCFCPDYDLTDVTCRNYSTNPVTYYKRDDCICMEKDQSYMREGTSMRTYHEEENYYYDFVDLYTMEKENISLMDRNYRIIPIPSVGDLTGSVGHTMRGLTGTYILNFSAIKFPKKLNVTDFQNASLTVFIHFRNDTTTQTFSLFPARDEPNLTIDVRMRNSTKILIESITPGRYNLDPETEIRTVIKLIDSISGEGIPNKDVRMEIEGYGLDQTETTNASGRASFFFVIGDHSTKVNFLFGGNDRFLGNKASDYYDVTPMKMLWWFLSPEVFLLILILIIVVLSYRWFMKGRIG